MSRREAIAAASLVIAGACAGTPDVVKKSSAPQPPRWVLVAPQDGQYLYFTGAKSGASSLDEGKAGALATALEQASQFIGVKVTAEGSYTMSTTDSENKARSDVTTSTQGQLRSAQLADAYYEATLRTVGANEIDRYDVWVLVKLPKAEAEAERERRAKEKAAHATAAFAQFSQGKSAQTSGDLKTAVFYFKQGAAELGTLDEAVDLNQGGFATTRDLSNALQLALRAALADKRRLHIVYAETALGLPGEGVCAGRLSEIFAEKGFSVLPALAGNAGDLAAALAASRGSGAKVAILMTATATRTGTVFGTQAAVTANVSARAVDVQSGEVVAQSDASGRGIKGDPRVAAHEALKQAAELCAQELATALLARESTQ